MKADLKRSADNANETFTKYGTRDPFQILKSIDNVRIMSFQEMSDRVNVERAELIDMFGHWNNDAVTTVYIIGNSLRYVVAYNRMLPKDELYMALARELGHIVLEHDGTRPEESRNAEAICFAENLINGK